MKKIILTGGGTAGHVTPNLALIHFLKKEGYEVFYIGSENGIEKELVEAKGIPYYSVSTGKLRRYSSGENIKDFFRVGKGVLQATNIIRKLKPDVVFSKGGFVAVPVVLGAKANGVPVIIHESDITPGLANKISMPSAKIICTTFPETLEYVNKRKGVHTGAPIRHELFEGMIQKGLVKCKFGKRKPVLLMMGGSLGAVKLNNALRSVLPQLLDEFQIMHICGKGNLVEGLKDIVGYCQFEYVSSGLEDLLAAADIIVSRAGSNSISEFLALNKPNLLIPLSKEASRGDQILNAESFRKQGYSMVLEEERLTGEALFVKIMQLSETKEVYIEAMRHREGYQEEGQNNHGTENIMREIRKF